MKNQNFEEANKILDSVVQGCKYLVSQSKLKKEEPTGFSVYNIITNIPNLNQILVGIVVVIISLFLFSIIRAKSKKRKK